MVSTQNHDPMAQTSDSDLERMVGRREATGRFRSIDGVDHYEIIDVDAMEPFLSTVVSDVDLWMFVSSAGSLTAGRVDADRALFPYVTDDQIHRATGSVGPVTLVARTVNGARELWRPFGRERDEGCRRSLAKSVLGDRIVFEERNPTWGLTYRATWAPSRAHGWVRSVELENDGGHVELDVLDGLLDIMPSGVDAGLEQTRSNLVDAFKRSETVPRAERLAVYNLESLITDRAEPGESLTAAAVWSWGFDGASVDLDQRSVRAFGDGRPAVATGKIAGRPGAYLLRGGVVLEPGARTSWNFVLDTALDHAAIESMAAAVATPGIAARVLDDLKDGSARLRELLRGADAEQRTGDPMADAHHLSNVLFNSMRGGVFPYEQRIPMTDFVQFVEQRNRLVAPRVRDWAGGGQWMEAAALRARAAEDGDPDLERLVLEYLPLTFSRRHGDPSRPWNRFSIHVTHDDGSEILRYEGNWRDIFQNWEALLHAYPTYFGHVVAKFVNASTLDGYNPYRISREGVDWEEPDPHDPWANIGYWGDHQIIYLLRLLEGWERFEPGALASWLDRPAFVYADVPYRISDRSQMIADPRNTITYLHDRAEAVAEREAKLGGDGRLVVDTGGDLFRVGLGEKLLVPALAKMSNLIPGAGIWMNTQRPEWNDANNALAGPGVSMVTVFHLHRYLEFLRGVLAGRDTVCLSPAVTAWLRDLIEIYRRHDAASLDAGERRALVDALGVAADAQGRRVLAGVRSELVDLPASSILGFVDLAVDALEAAIRASVRPDGLVDSYNLVSFPTDTTLEVEQLGPMLEGQVAALSCRLFSPADAVRRIDALYASEMFRADLDSFMLYPVAEIDPFRERNRVPDGALPDAIELSMPSVFVRDGNGVLRFRPAAANADALAGLLDADDVPEQDRNTIREVYEQVFQHASFTGRSGSMYGYEGIGSIYWHMVSKLLLAVQEVYWDARDADARSADVERLAAAYRRIRVGLGFTKDPAVFGAFPVDCYSHSPAHSGAQQPGMTGQVKEEVLSRLGELGLSIRAGQVHLHPELLPADELFRFQDSTPEARFTLCGVPMVVGLGQDRKVSVVTAEGVTSRSGDSLTVEESAALFSRAGEIQRVEWQIPG